MDPWKSDYKSKQGNIGLGVAIAYFTSIGVPVMIPLNDTQSYDLVIDMENKLMRVSVKTTQQKNKRGSYVTLLKRSGGNGKQTRLFDNTSCDLLFIFTKEGKRYLIPSNIITQKNSITLTKKLDKYIL